MADENFKYNEFAKGANEAEAAVRAGKTPEPKPQTETKTAEIVARETGTEGREQAQIPRHARREMNRMREEIGSLKGQIELLTKMGVQPASSERPAKQEAAPEPGAKPKRADFPEGKDGDAQFQEAIAGYVADQRAAASEQSKQIEQSINSAAAKASEDFTMLKTVVEDWDEVIKHSTEEGPEYDYSLPQYQNFTMLLGMSQYQALILYHFAKNPDELEDILKLSPDPKSTPAEQRKQAAKQIEEFKGLESHIRRVYSDLKKKAAQASKKDEKSEAKETQPADGTPKRKLPPPSESITVGKGSAPQAEIPIMTSDGKLNPAWRAKENERQSVRR